MITFIFVGILAFCFIIGPLLKTWNKVPVLPVYLLPLALGVLLTQAFGLEEIIDAKREVDLLISVCTGLLGFHLGLKGKTYLSHQRIIMSSVLIGAILFVVAFVLTSVFATALIQVKDLGWNMSLFHEAFIMNSLGEFFEFENEINFVAPACAAIAVAISPTPFEVLLGKTKFGPMLRRMRQMSLLNRALAVGLFGVVLSSIRPWQSAGQFGLSIAEWSALSIFSGIFCGFLFSLFIGRIEQTDKVFLSAIGAIIFASGMGKSLGVSPLFVNMVFGLVVAYFSRHAKQVEDSLVSLEAPVLCLLYVLAGLCLHNPDPKFVALAGLLLAGRYVSVYVSRLAITGLMRHPAFNFPSSLITFVAQDFVCLALALSYYQRFPETGTQVLFTYTLVTLLTKVFSMQHAKVFAYNSGELGVKVSRKQTVPEQPQAVATAAKQNSHTTPPPSDNAVQEKTQE